MARLTALYRSPVPLAPAVAWAWLASGIVLVAAGISHGPESGLRGAIVVFVTWATVRELAPGRAAASLLAPFAAVAWAISAETDVLCCVGVLLAARVAARTVGDPLTVIDLAGLLAIALAMALRPVGLPVAIVLAAIVFVDGTRRARIGGSVILAAVLVVGADLHQPRAASRRQVLPAFLSRPAVSRWHTARGHR